MTNLPCKLFAVISVSVLEAFYAFSEKRVLTVQPFATPIVAVTGVGTLLNTHLSGSSILGPITRKPKFGLSINGLHLHPESQKPIFRWTDDENHWIWVPWSSQFGTSKQGRTGHDRPRPPMGSAGVLLWQSSGGTNCWYQLHSTWSEV